MSNLYSRLVKGEDARTEALADLLERLLAGDRERNTRRFAKFVSEVLLADATVIQEKEEFMQGPISSPADVSVETQYPIPDGTKPDMVIFNGAEPLCVVEVKVDAAVADGQLEGYGRWLAENAGEGNTPALVFLTHATTAPTEFPNPGPGDGLYRVNLRSVAWWSSTAEWFATLSAEDCMDEPLRSLAGEFGKFLMEEAMPTLDDDAIARQYLAESEQKLTAAVNGMQGKFRFPEHWTPGQGVVKGRVGMWKYHYPEEDRETRYLQYGFGFKPVEENDRALFGLTRYMNAPEDEPRRVAVGDGYYAFVMICATAADCSRVPGFLQNCWYQWDGDALVAADAGLEVDSTGWWHCTNERHGYYSRIASLQELLGPDGRLGTRLQCWARDALGKSESLWNALFGEDG